jgi:hypothetical protein
MDNNWNGQKAKKPQVPRVYKRHGSKIRIIRYSKGKKKASRLQGWSLFNGFPPSF